VFGANGDEQLDPEASRMRLRKSPTTVERATGRRLPLDQIAEGFLDIACRQYAAAIRKISIARGHDVTRYTLACFGGRRGAARLRVADALAWSGS
jgi:5-oxoprolinase (ATP-hydrolysing)